MVEWAGVKGRRAEVAKPHTKTLISGELADLPLTNASVAELAYAHGLEPCGETLTGSNPVGGIGVGRTGLSRTFRQHTIVDETRRLVQILRQES